MNKQSIIITLLIAVFVVVALYFYSAYTKQQALLEQKRLANMQPAIQKVGVLDAIVAVSSIFGKKKQAAVVVEPLSTRPATAVPISQTRLENLIARDKFASR